ncbi:MAG: UrcA family protein [Henriciella sp.]|uniref:UrcA family protein n=1 Tax=Henriciella sp. TaxID=1968823 RepID=UPI003C75C6C3
MKILPLAAALITASLIGGVSHAKAFQCIDGQLVGGPEGFTSRINAQGQILDVERRVDRGTSYVAPRQSHGSYSYNDTYTRTQTYSAPATTTRIVQSSNTASAPAPRVTRTYTYSDPVYSSGAPSSAPAAEVRDVRVYRGGMAGATRPCSYYTSGANVTTYSGCSHSRAPRATHRTTMYLDPNPQRPELAGGAHHAAPRPSYDYASVVGLNSGVCDRKIQRLGEDYQGRTRYEVCYADLQPVYGRRVEKLYDRLETAARRACGKGSSITRISTTRDCREQAVEMAVYDTGLQSLVNYHVAKTGGRPRVVVGPLRRY